MGAPRVGRWRSQRRGGFSSVSCSSGRLRRSAARPGLRRHPLGRGRPSSIWLEDIAAGLMSAHAPLCVWRGRSSSTFGPVGEEERSTDDSPARAPLGNESRRLIANLVGARARRARCEGASPKPPRATHSLSRRCSLLLTRLVRREGVAAEDLRVPPTSMRFSPLGSTARRRRAHSDGARRCRGKAVLRRTQSRSSLPSRSRPAVGDSLGSLVRKELIRPEHAEPRVTELPLPTSAHSGRGLRSDSKGARARTTRALRTLARRAAGDRAEYEEFVGYHLEQAYLYRTEFGPIDDASRLGAEAADD